MMKKLSALALCLCLMIGGLVGCGGSGDPNIDLAQNTMNALMSGNQAADPMLDFETLQFLGTNIGDTYRLQPGDAQKAAYRTQFVTSAAGQFQNMHANSATFSNWRVTGQDPAQTVVMADTLHEAKLTVVITKRMGEPKVSSISIG